MTEDDHILIEEKSRRYRSFPKRFRGLSLDGIDEEDLDEDELMHDYFRYLQYLMR